MASGSNPKSFFSSVGFGSKMNFCFGEIENSMEVSGEKGEKWSNSSRDLDGDELAQDGNELAQDGSKHVLLQWKHSEVNSSAFSQGEEESGLLECSPLSKWDPKEHKELEVI